MRKYDLGATGWCQSILGATHTHLSIIVTIPTYHRQNYREHEKLGVVDENVEGQVGICSDTSAQLSHGLCSHTVLVYFKCRQPV